MEAVAGLGKAARMAGDGENVLSRQSVTTNQDSPRDVSPRERSTELPAPSSSVQATETHRSLDSEEAAVSIEKFNLWYGQTQALFDVSMIVPKGKVTALI